MSARHVVVGGGVAAASAVAGLRAGGFEGAIVLVSDDESLPYERPPLSKSFLDADSEPEPTFVHDEAWYAEQQIDALLGVRAQRIHPREHRVDLSTGESLDYGGLILATGVRPRPGPGTAERVVLLRSLAHGREIRARLANAEHVAVLGGGFIGCEVAATATALGKRATIIERAGVLMKNALGPALGEVFTDIHRAKGVETLLNRVVLAVEERRDSVVVRTDHGTVEADLVVVGAGCVPNVELAAEAGITAADGIVTDEFCRTNVPDIYAAGDVASVYHPFYDRHLRVEHHDTAMHQGAAAARNLLGYREPFLDAHWFWSDQYEHKLQRVGRPAPSDEVVIRGSVDELDFSAFSLHDNRIRSVTSLNRGRDALAVRRLLFADHSATAEQLRDESVQLKRLAARPSIRASRLEAS
ncbi:3-phenylpropionate/trans-cinnamate dioxygenase ferredoxin reductase subunit [Nocardia transvalensis]|uniref:3-phenylpropionate/trans-cinnamate dioxygenase ferredoxin reductase subunit n=1 Tax=Nocardia transvalensis TaxID=37333 RepID=A0A7W9PI74_9NOCA|nr:FAD-dependent oxidoreductase [Nocardia transvalensis]MBB5916616.1 3-phenylpropionate/trans-cinnamate dioxygenase ferredoxin reductase subunit [Nocardia transvalensis]